MRRKTNGAKNLALLRGALWALIPSDQFDSLNAAFDHYRDYRTAALHPNAPSQPIARLMPLIHGKYAGHAMLGVVSVSAMLKSIALLCPTLLLSSLCQGGEADAFQEPVAPVPAADDWEFRLAVYGPMVGLDGTAMVGGVVLPVDIGFGDILDNLDGGVVIAGEARKGKWSVTGDYIWLKLSTSTRPTPNSYVGVTVQETLGNLALGYELYEDRCWTIDLLAGAAYMSVDIDADVTLGPPVSRTAFSSVSESWVDPFVGVRFRYRAGDHWRFFGRVDYGGWGVASDTYFQANVGAGYQINKSVGLFAAYRYHSVDYAKGQFGYDVDTKGPEVGVVFSF